MKEKYLKPSNIKNFKITNSIFTDSASFYIGDKIYLEKKRNEYNKLYISGNNESLEKQHTFHHDTTNEGIIYDESQYISKLPNMLSTNWLDRKKILNLNLSFFSLAIMEDTFIPIYFFEFNKELDSFFVPLIFPGEFIYWNKLWNEKNISLKKSIINQFSEEKSKWIKIGKLNIPSKKLLTQEGHFISTGKMWELEHDIYKSKEEYDIFAIYSDKEDLYKIYNNPEHLDLDEKFRTDVSGDILPKNNPLNFEKILYGLFFKSKN